MKSRISYIDGMKALAIFLVVYAHVLYNSYDCAPIASIHNVFVNFFVALFFFTSGIFASKINDIRGTELCRYLLNKSYQLLIPTLVFGFIYSFYFDKGLDGLVLHPLKNGYWFTFVLLICFILFSINCTITRICTVRIKLVILLTGTILVYAISIYCQKHPTILGNALSIPQLNYYVYFVLGAVCKNNISRLFILFSNNIFSTSLVVCLFIFILFSKQLHHVIHFPLQGTLIQVTYSSACIIIIFMFFKKYAKWFENHVNPVSKFVNIIGKRTLDIYMIHYFFIPGCLDGIAAFLTKSDSVVIDFMITSVIVLGIISFSLLISELIRLSPILSHFLLGTRK